MVSVLTDLTFILQKGQTLVADQVRLAVDALLDEGVSSESKEAFLIALSDRGIQAVDLAHFAQAILPHAVDPGFYQTWEGKPILDCCGTGGGGLNIFNVSTASLLVMAAAGVPVVKHGNRGITKKSGSADILESLGIKIDLGPTQIRDCVAQVGLAFVFAPQFHPAFKKIAPIRKKLAAEGRSTIFNLLGPLLNPVRPQAHLLGVFREEHLSLFHEALRLLNPQDRHIVVCGFSKEGKPIGEASVEGRTIAYGFNGLSLQQYVFPARNAHFALQEIMVASAAESAAMVVAVLENRHQGLAREMVLVNAALGLLAQGSVSMLEEGYQRAQEALVSGGALKKLRAWQQFSPALA